jgi:hypothetical protein
VIVNKYGRVAGSIDLAQLADLYAQATDEDLKAHFRQVAAENGANLDEAEPEPESEPESEPAAESESEPAEVKASMALSKDELVTLAESAGLGTREELEQFTKQDLVDELKVSEED